MKKSNLQKINDCKSSIFTDYHIGNFSLKEPDDIFLSPHHSMQHDIEFWYTQLERKMMGDRYFLISGFGLYK